MIKKIVNISKIYTWNPIKDELDIILNQEILIKNCKITATVSGSVGWEGLLHLKPSIQFSENWLSYCNSSRYVSSKDEICLVRIK